MEFSRRSLLSGLALSAAATMPALAGEKQSQIKDLRPLLEKAIQQGGVAELPAGRFALSGLEISAPLRISGAAGQTIIECRDGEPSFRIRGADGVSICGITFTGSGAPPADDFALVAAIDATGLIIEDCRFISSTGSGLRLEGCGGRISGNKFRDIAGAAIFARNSSGLEIVGNDIADIGNNGILVWTGEPAEDGTLVSGNRIARIAARRGGSGQNGNGINVYQAGNVIVSGNRISDCAFSAVRNNAGSNCQIVNNSISRTREVAIYCEFGFEGAVVAGNLIEDVAFGISITNFNEGGRLASVAGNVIRKVRGGGTLDYTRGVGIGAEADTAVSGNVIEDTADSGISLGWGAYARDLSATGNLLRNCRRGIVFSVAAGAGPVLVANNRISGAADGSIIGVDHGEAATGDLSLPDAVPPPGSVISGNLVS